MCQEFTFYLQKRQKKLDIYTKKKYNIKYVKGAIGMIQTNAYNYINVLDKAADASWLRSQVISNNIANVDTPGFKRKDVEFESYLAYELEGANSKTLAQRISEVDLTNLTATSYTENEGLSYRLDENNVDIDTENVEFASNQIQYNAFIDSINYQFNMLKAAMTSS